LREFLIKRQGVNITITHVLHFAFIGVYFLCGMFILLLRDAKRPTVYMGVARLFTAAVFVVHFVQFYTMPQYGSILFNPLHLFSPLVSFPLQFAYFFCLMRPESVRRPYWLVTLIPAVALWALYFIVVRVKGHALVFSDYAQIAASAGEPELWLRLLALALLMVETVVLSVAGFRMQRRHVSNLAADFSYTEGISLQWIRWVIYIFLLRGCCAVLNMAMEGPVIKLVNAVVFTLEAVITTVWVLRQKDLYTRPAANDADDSEPDLTDNMNGVETKNKKRKIIKQNLLALLEKDEIFKDPDLNSDKVCAMLSTNRTYLSLVINQEINTTFYQLINTCRLNKSLEMMQNPQHRQMKLSYIAEICGFKSLGAFSTFFKQTYGKTPTEWRKVN
jgi:AraC-like DNA-binding protein